MASKELIEKVARSLYESWENVPHASNRDWDAYVEKLPGGADCFRKHAKAAISIILAALQEPTPAMQLVVSANWGRRTWSEYQQVLNASPLGEQRE